MAAGVRDVPAPRLGPQAEDTVTDPRIDIVDDDDEIVAPDNDPVPEEGEPA